MFDINSVRALFQHRSRSCNLFIFILIVGLGGWLTYSYIYSSEADEHGRSTYCYFEGQSNFNEEDLLDRVYTHQGVWDALHFHIEGETRIFRDVKTANMNLTKFLIYKEGEVVYAEPREFAKLQEKGRLKALPGSNEEEGVKYEVYTVIEIYFPKTIEGKVVSAVRGYADSNLFGVEFSTKKECDEWILENIKEEKTDIRRKETAQDYLKQSVD